MMLTYEYYRNNLEELSKYTNSESIPLNCSNCFKIYYHLKRYARNHIFEYGGRKTVNCFCSKECRNSFYKTSVDKPCGFCKKIVTRLFAEYAASKSKNIFCNHSCAASYNNTHKKHGTRRSKLEYYLEEQIKILYPTLEIIVNGKNTIESELDFYFPQLKFAIELNGPTHYEPIYGQDKFEKIQNNDKQKIIRCYEKGIELMIIDVSKVTYMNESRKKHYLNLIVDQLNIIKNRAKCTSGMV